MRLACDLQRQKPYQKKPNITGTKIGGLDRLAVAAHDGIARAIQPAHSPFDGDLLFAVSTGAGPVVDDMALFELGHAASVCVARAIARGVFEATPRPGDVLPTWNDRKRKAQI